MKRKTILVLLVLAVITIGVYYYAYKGHRNIAEEEAVFSGEAIALYTSFSKPTTAAMDMFSNQTVVVTGLVTAIEANVLTLDKVLLAQFDSLPTGLRISDKLSIKGRCIGYDDLFEVVALDQCIIMD